MCVCVHACVCMYMHGYIYDFFESYIHPEAVPSSKLTQTMHKVLSSNTTCIATVSVSVCTESTDYKLVLKHLAWHATAPYRLAHLSQADARQLFCCTFWGKGTPCISSVASII